MQFWPKQAEDFLLEKEYDKVIELCSNNIPAQPKLLSARLIYSRALRALRRINEAIEQLYEALAIDPDNFVALKLLGDIRFEQGDVVSAMANYSRILEIDPDCRGIKSDLPVKIKEVEPARKITLQRPAETKVPEKTMNVGRPFRTETVGDLYLAQGQPRLAMEIFEELVELHQNNRLKEKLNNAERMVALKERRDVDQKN